MSSTPVWLIDASIYVFRPWFVRHQTAVDRDGQPIHAVLGFLRFLYTLLQQEQPQHIALAFDTSRLTSVRKSIYPDYKAHRPAAPDELKYQFQTCREFLRALGLVEAASLQYEADDIIGTWARHYQAQGMPCRIISGDKDLAQLVAKDDLWWDYGKRAALPPGGIKREFGVWPAQIAEQLAIAGDAADNIPGVPGIGMATAAKLLQKFSTVEMLLSRIPEIGQMKTAGAKRLQSLIQQHQDTIRLARQLTEIHCNVPEIPLDIQRGNKDLPRLQELCERLQLTAQQYQLWVGV